MTKLIINVVCDRVIYFTNDPKFKAPITHYTWEVEYSGDLPSSMSLLNCWSWKYINNRLVYSSETTTISHAITDNKKEILKLLSKKFDELAEPYLPSSKLSAYFRRKKKSEAEIFLSKGFAPLLLDISKETNKTVESIAMNILEKDHLENIALYQLELKRTILKNKIDSATNIRDLELLRREIESLK